MRNKQATHLNRADQTRKIYFLIVLIGLCIVILASVGMYDWLGVLDPESVKERFKDYLRGTSDQWKSVDWIECDTKNNTYEVTVEFNTDLFHLKVNVTDSPSIVIQIHDASLRGDPIATLALEQEKLKWTTKNKLESSREHRMKARCLAVYEAFLYAINKPIKPDPLHPTLVR